MNVDRDLSARVARGVALLDEHVPGWVDNVALDGLRTSSRTWCVVGQQPLGWRATLKVLGLHNSNGLDYDRIVAAGFDSDNTTYLAYGLLDAEWERVILDRRAGRSAQPTRRVSWWRRLLGRRGN